MTVPDFLSHVNTHRLNGLSVTRAYVTPDVLDELRQDAVIRKFRWTQRWRTRAVEPSPEPVMTLFGVEIVEREQAQDFIFE